MRYDCDIYGREIMGCFRNGNDKEIIERSDGLIIASSQYGAGYYFSEHEDWQPYETEALTHLHGRVLDIGCGGCRHTLYVQKKGLTVLGIDNSPLAIRVCRLRGVKKVKVMAFEEIGELKTASFDTMLMLGNNFGLFGSFAKARRLLKQMHRIAAPGGTLIAESLDPYQTKKPVHLRYYRYNKARGRMPGQMRFRLRYEDLAGPWFDYLYVSPKEMRTILNGTGWTLSKVIPSESSHYIGIIERL